jgi:hypothetical protein
MPKKTEATPKSKRKEQEVYQEHLYMKILLQQNLQGTSVVFLLID